MVRSKVWNFFTVCPGDERHANMCGDKLSRGNKTSNTTEISAEGQQTKVTCAQLIQILHKVKKSLK